MPKSAGLSRARRAFRNSPSSARRRSPGRCAAWPFDSYVTKASSHHRICPKLNLAVPTDISGAVRGDAVTLAAGRAGVDCQSYAARHDRGCGGYRARGCPRHAVAALNGIAGAHVDWPDSKGLNEWERTAVELAEERSKLG